MAGMMDKCAQAISRERIVLSGIGPEKLVSQDDYDLARAALTAVKEMADQLGNEATSVFLEAILSDSPLPPPPEEG